MSPLLVYYCLAILVVSVLGGMLPEWLRLTHRWMECAVSFVAGVMLGVAVLHLLPHAWLSIGASPSDPANFQPVALWLLAGFLAMFFVERFFCFHHHDVPEESTEAGGEAFECHDHDHAHSDHAHNLTWSGATLGLTLHSLMAGVALAASVRHGATVSPDGWASGWAGGLAGIGTFLAILLHKPFDSMTIAMLMAKGGWSPVARCVVNALFALAIPVGALLASLGISADDPASPAIGYALAFSAGVFLCISMSDLLPELQFHHHDRIKLSAALILGLALAYVACQFETHSHAAPQPAGAGNVAVE